uniref:Matrix metallopeptidase 28 n=1 Tax=Bos indicus x Bos taurus TaxID=30522 RepID=A0A4W2BTP3_BOBOX
MAARVGLLLRVLPLLLWGGLDAQRVGPELRREAEAFLEKYGYLSDQGPSRPSSTQFSNAIREFQWVSQLPISGVLDPPTLHQMTRPRCGVADTDSQMPWTERVSALFAGRWAKMRRKKRFARQGRTTGTSQPKAHVCEHRHLNQNDAYIDELSLCSIFQSKLHQAHLIPSSICYVWQLNHRHFLLYLTKVVFIRIDSFFIRIVQQRCDSSISFMLAVVLLSFLQSYGNTIHIPYNLPT